jgi:hypothetical protein
MRVIIATCAGLVALSTISAQAAPLPSSKAVPTELTISPIVPAADGCGYGYRRTRWGSVGPLALVPLRFKDAQESFSRKHAKLGVLIHNSADFRPLRQRRALPEFAT